MSQEEKNNRMLKRFFLAVVLGVLSYGGYVLYDLRREVIEYQEAERELQQSP